MANGPTRGGRERCSGCCWGGVAAHSGRELPPVSFVEVPGAAASLRVAGCLADWWWWFDRTARHGRPGGISAAHCGGLRLAGWAAGWEVERWSPRGGPRSLSCPAGWLNWLADRRRVGCSAARLDSWLRRGRDGLFRPTRPCGGGFIVLSLLEGCWRVRRLAGRPAGWVEVGWSPNGGLASWLADGLPVALADLPVGWLAVLGWVEPREVEDPLPGSAGWLAGGKAGVRGWVET